MTYLEPPNPPACILSDGGDRKKKKNMESLLELIVVETSLTSLCEVKTRVTITS